MFRELLAREASAHFSLNARQLDQLEAHYNLLTAWNSKINLTRIRSVEEAVTLHYCESLFAANCLPSGNLHVADVGSGGGFPGIPMGILRPEIQVTLIESHQRKAVFLREAARPLQNVAVIPRRAEDVQTTFDWVVSRAVAPKDVLKLELAPRFALLLGEEAGELGPKWDVRKVPWGDRRALGMFHVEHSGGG